eukprot:1790-Chlamydomonas_euryale.AAC.2
MFSSIHIAHLPMQLAPLVCLEVGPAKIAKHGKWLAWFCAGSIPRASGPHASAPCGRPCPSQDLPSSIPRPGSIALPAYWPGAGRIHTHAPHTVRLQVRAEQQRLAAIQREISELEADNEAVRRSLAARD